MANRINIGFGTIFKRSSCLNSISGSNIDAGKGIDNLNSQLKATSADGRGISPSIKTSLRSFIESISNLDNANKYYRNTLYFIQELNKLDTNLAKYLLNEYTNQVLPYVNDLSRIGESIERYNLTDEQKQVIVEAATKYTTADRILINHEKICKRFNILSEAKKVNSRGLKYAVESCCSMIDTYNIQPYAKFNLCLEELGYLFDKEGISYNKKDFVKYVTEYFLLRSPEISDKDIKGYRVVLNENCYITDEDTEAVDYVLYPPTSESNKKTSIAKEIQQFLIIQNKSILDLGNAVNNSLTSSDEDLKFNLVKLLWLVWDVYRSELFDNNELEKHIRVWLKNIVKRLDNISIEDNNSNSRDRNIVIIDNVKKFRELISVVGSSDTYDNSRNVIVFGRLIDEFIESINFLNFVAYSDNNIKAINFANSTDVEPIPLKEFKVFKYHNLVRANLLFENFLKNKSKNICFENSKFTEKVLSRRTKDTLFTESLSEIYSYIGEDAKVDICAAQYYINEDHVESIQKFLEEVCKEYNDKLICENFNSVRCFYIINPGIAEIHLKDSTPIKLEETDWKAVRESYNSDLDIYIDEFALIQTCLESFDMFSESELDIDKRLTTFFNNPNLTLEHFEVALEALSLLNVTKEQVNVFTEAFNNYRYNTAVLESVITESQYLKESNIAKIMSNRWVAEVDVPIHIQLEAFQILSAVLEAGPNLKKPDFKKPNIGVNKNNNKYDDDDEDDIDDVEDDDDDSGNNNDSHDKGNNSGKPEIKKPNIGPNKNNHKNNDGNENEGGSDNENGDGSNNESDEKKKKNPFAALRLNNMRLYLEGLKNKFRNMSAKEQEASRNLDNSFRRFAKSLKDAMISDRREAIIKGSVIPSFSKCIKIAIGLAGIGLVAGNPIVPLLVAIGGMAVSKKLTDKERILLLDEIETELEMVEKEISMAESRNEMKKHRTLLKYKKDLQRQYQRIRYNVKVGKNLLPGSTVGVKTGTD